MGDPLDAVAPYVLLVREICKSCQLGHDKAGRKERKPGQHRTTGGGADEHRAESTTPDSWTEPSAEGSCWPIAAATGGGRRLARSSVTRSTPCGASSSGARHTSAVEPRSTRSARRCRISSSTPPYASSAPQTRCVRRQADQVDVATSEHRPSLRIDARDPVSTGSRATRLRSCQQSTRNDRRSGGCRLPGHPPSTGPASRYPRGSTVTDLPAREVICWQIASTASTDDRPRTAQSTGCRRPDTRGFRHTRLLSAGPAAS